MIPGATAYGGRRESDAGKEGDRGYADEPLTTIGNRDQSPWRLLGYGCGKCTRLVALEE